MSAVKGKVKEQREFSKKTGFFEGKVLAFNPTREQLEKILGTKLEKDPEYLSEEDNGTKKLSLVVWLRDVVTNDVRSVRFFLKDVPKINKEKTRKQYINSVGATQWVDEEKNLFDWFKEKPYRLAKEGEGEMYNFITNWLKLDFKNDKTVSLDFDWSKLMRGNVKEFNELIGSEYDNTIVCLVTVRSVDKEADGKKETVQYEQIYSREFLPGYVMKQIVLKKIDDSFIEAAKNTEKKKRSKLQRFILSVTDKQYGITDYFTLGLLQDYDPTKNVAAGNKVINEDDLSY